MTHNPDDFSYCTYSSRETSGWGMRTPLGVRVTHKPSGLSVACESERSQFLNRDTAFRQLIAQLPKSPMNEETKQLLRALADGKTLCYKAENKLVELSFEGAMRHLANGAPQTLQVLPEMIHRFIPVVRMPAGSIVLAEAKTEREFAIDANYTKINSFEQIIAVLHVKLNKVTLELISSEMENLP